ncbi:predicted protein [Naegleria gruberi]|uniref:Predicted protein n=1 Tax=Naegleria gruberi TaxID=5762 RepID=D2V8M4_NAEGR|nr:uncharacterized protein NAEGRDRAFT_65210 [Naegleria gruberi]EFC46714.1 predicted protein [Naegleria gruberi]|eukprot:XP_002679458.1 predicted protein [Naegleria gruberi strain NEG-M]
MSTQPPPTQTKVKEETIEVKGTPTGGADNKSSSANKKVTKYKPPESVNKALSKGLQFAPYARNMVNGDIYILFIFGIVAIAMAQDRTTSLPWATVPGIYCVVLSIFLYIWHFISEFTKTDKSVDSVLAPKGWPKIICMILSAFNYNPVQCVFCAIASVYCFFCVQTAICGVPLVMASILYLIASIRREASAKITGLI